MPPQVTILPVAPDQWEAVPIQVTIRDAESDRAMLSVSYSEGGPFVRAAPFPDGGPTDFATSKNGAPATSLWDSRADLGARNVENVVVSVVATDRGGGSRSALSNPFAVRNRLRAQAVQAGDPGDTVEIVGLGFGGVPAAVTVHFPAPVGTGPLDATPSDVSDGRLHVLVPDRVVAGAVRVETAGLSSNPVPFAPVGAAHFMAGPMAPAGVAAVAPLAADVDGDGRIDLVQGGVWRNLGGASFLPLVASWGSARALAGDVDGDGDCDLVVLPAGAPPILLLQQGASFIDASALIDERATLVGSKPDARLLDVDGDGATDLVIVGALASGAASLHLWAGGRWQVHVDGVLAAAQPATALGALDVDGDGMIDLLLGRSGGADLLLGRGSAVFARAPALLGYRPPTADLFAQAGDLDGDGAPDLVAAQPLGYWRTLPAGGGLQGASSLAGVYAPLAPNAAVLADVNDDGWLDLYAVAPGRAYLFLASAPGQFVEQAAAAGLGAPAHPTGAVAADFDGDGRLDLYDGERIWRNTLALGNGHVEVSIVGPWAGSRLTLTTPDGVRQVRVPDSSALPVHFGLGNAASAQLEVRFGNGQTTMRSVASGDRIRVSVP